MTDDAHSRFFIARTSPVELPHDSGERRLAIRPPMMRDADYPEKFDDTHLYYDVFWDGRRVVGLGPNLINLTRLVRDAPVLLDGVAASEPPRIRRGGLRDFTFIEAPSAPRLLTLGAPPLRWDVPVQPSHAKVFAGRKVLTTLSRDNALVWIADWVEFHVRAHGVDAVLIYDNASSAYGLAELLARLQTIPGLAAAVVVDWPFKYGPIGTADGKYWDSNFCQPVMLEDARRRFLPDAAAMVNADIDELIVTDDGRSIFAHLAEASSGALVYPGRWIRSVQTDGEAEGAVIRHRDFRYGRRDDPWCPSKWTAVPARLPDTIELHVHGFNPPFEATRASGVAFRHFRAITTNWNYRRPSASLHDPARHMVDTVWERQMQAIGWA